MEVLTTSPVSMAATSPETSFIDTAATIGSTLCRDAIWAGTRCTFLTSTNDTAFETPKPYFKSLDADFYAGSAGIAFFLAALYNATGDRIVRKTAIGTLRNALETARRIPEQAALGFYSGLTGIAYTAIEAGKWLHDDELSMQGRPILDKVTQLDLQHTGLDVIDGAAGVIPALIKLDRDSPSPALRALVVRLADLLVRNAERSPEGVSWKTVVGADHRNLTGFAHGVAGIVNALFEAFNLTQDVRYRDLAFQGLRYENAFFNQQEQNWPDFRMKSQSSAYSLSTENAGPTCSCAWCHGAPGIALSRLRAYELTQHPALKTEALTALKTTASQSGWDQQANFSLCHGLAGNADVLLEAADVLAMPDWRAQAVTIGEIGQERYRKTGLWANGLYNTYQIPDFMLGLSGTGYFYLRLADPKTYRSALLIQ